MRLTRPRPFELVLPAGPAVRHDAGAAGPAGRAVHADAVLRLAPDDGLAAKPGLRGEPEAGAPPAGAVGAGGDLPQAADQYPGAGASDLSLSVAGGGDHAGRPGVEF